MSAEDLEKYETEMELSLYREYKDIVGQFSYVVETERRFYLANSVEMVPRNADGEVYFLELNPLPSLAPGERDLYAAAAAISKSSQDLIAHIVAQAA